MVYSENYITWNTPSSSATIYSSQQYHWAALLYYVPGMGSINRVKLLHMTTFFNMIMFLCMDAYSEEKLAMLRALKILT